jgi:group I intron endonuclease
MANLIGIYSITNKVNKKVYIGQSWDILSRWKSYREGATNSHLKDSFKKYGFNNFYFGIVLLFLPSVNQAQLDKAEDDYIVAGNFTDPKFGYNMRFGGSRGKHNKESKRKISEAGKGRVHSEEQKNKIRETSKGRIYSKETRKKIGAVNKGKIRSKETIEKLRASHLGNKQSKESIEKMLRWRKENYVMSDETKKKIGNSNKGKKRTQETIDKMREAFKGKPWTEARIKAQENRRII